MTTCDDRVHTRHDLLSVLDGHDVVLATGQSCDGVPRCRRIVIALGGAVRRDFVGRHHVTRVGKGFGAIGECPTGMVEMQVRERHHVDVAGWHAERPEHVDQRAAVDAAERQCFGHPADARVDQHCGPGDLDQKTTGAHQQLPAGGHQLRPGVGGDCGEEDLGAQGDHTVHDVGDGDVVERQAPDGGTVPAVADGVLLEWRHGSSCGTWCGVLSKRFSNVL